MACKSNCAAHVMINTPTCHRSDDELYYSYPIIILIPYRESPVRLLAMGVIIVTYENSPIQSQDSCQGPGTSPKRNVQSPCRRHPGPFVSGGEILRSPGPDPGQIRNAAPGREGRLAHQRRCRQLRLLAAGFLQGSARLYPRGSDGAYCPTPRPQRRAQGDEGNRVICRTNSLPGTVDRNAGTGAADSKGVCRDGASQNRGAGAGGREKKTGQTISGRAGQKHALTPEVLVEQYERLRSYALARNSTSGSRLGQGALMAHGMVKWIEIAGELIARSPAVPTEEVPAMPFPVQDEVIRFMGGAVIALVYGGAL